MKNTGQVTGAATADGDNQKTGADPTIDQVRDLLFGGAQRSLESRLAELQQEMQTSLTRLQAQFDKELETVRNHLRELEQETDRKRLESQRDIGAAISQLGASISALGAERPGK